MYMRVRVCLCVRLCVCACVRLWVCERVCVCVCARAQFVPHLLTGSLKYRIGGPPSPIPSPLPTPFPAALCCASHPKTSSSTP